MLDLDTIENNVMFYGLLLFLICKYQSNKPKKECYLLTLYATGSNFRFIHHCVLTLK